MSQDKSYHHTTYKGAHIMYETTGLTKEEWQARSDKMVALIDVHISQGIMTHYIIGEYYSIDFTDLIKEPWTKGNTTHE